MNIIARFTLEVESSYCAPLVLLNVVSHHTRECEYARDTNQTKIHWTNTVRNANKCKCKQCYIAAHCWCTMIHQIILLNLFFLLQCVDCRWCSQSKSPHLCFCTDSSDDWNIFHEIGMPLNGLHCVSIASKPIAYLE